MTLYRLRQCWLFKKLKNHNWLKEHDADDDLDSLFTNKKANLDGLDFDRYLYEPVSFDEWKDFVVSSIQ